MLAVSNNSRENPITIDDESPPPTERRPHYTTSRSAQQSVTSSIEEKGTGGKDTDQPLASTEHGGYSLGDRKRPEEPISPIQVAVDRDSQDRFSRPMTLPTGVSEWGGARMSLPCSYHNVSEQASGDEEIPSNFLKGLPSTGLPANPRWPANSIVQPEILPLNPTGTDRANFPDLDRQLAPDIDGVATTDERHLVPPDKERTYSPNATLLDSFGQRSKIPYNSLNQPDDPLSATRDGVKANPSRTDTKAKAGIDIAWFICLNRDAVGPPKSRLPDLEQGSLNNVTLVRVIEQARAKIPAGTEIHNISLTFRSYPYDKDFPEFKDVVERHDFEGFYRFKMEAIDSIREYAEKGVEEYKIVLEVNQR